MASLQTTLPLNDSLRVSYSVRNPDGTLMSLTGFTGEMVVKASPTNAAPAIVTVTGVLQPSGTAFLFNVPPNTLNTVGTLHATVRVVNATESYSETLTIKTVDHA